MKRSQQTVSKIVDVCSRGAISANPLRTKSDGRIKMAPRDR